jgi:hypothetical protein
LLALRAGIGQNRLSLCESKRSLSLTLAKQKATHNPTTLEEVTATACWHHLPSGRLNDRPSLVAGLRGSARYRPELLASPATSWSSLIPEDSSSSESPGRLSGTVMAVPFPPPASNRRKRLYRSGGREIRTPGTLRYAGFQDQCIRPLCHPSVCLNHRVLLSCEIV